MELLRTTGWLCLAVGSIQRWNVRDLAVVIKQLTIMEDKRMIMAAQDQALRTRYIQRAMMELTSPLVALWRSG